MVALGGGHAWLLWGGVMHGCSGGWHAWLLPEGGGMHGCSGGLCVVAPGGCMVAQGCAWLLPGGDVHGFLGGHA